MNIGPKTKGKYYRHGYSHTRIDHIYKSMISRCHKVDYSNKNYLKYGAKGITVCEEWRQNKVAFFEWAFANGYKEDLTIDRIDPSKGYSPENCRWVSYITQNNHRKSNRFIEVDGESHTIAEWSRITGVKPGTIQHRISHGWNSRDAVYATTDKGDNTHE